MELVFDTKKTASIFIRIKEEMKKKLDALAKKHNSNRSEIARKLITESLKRMEE